MTRNSTKKTQPGTALVTGEWLLQTLERVKSGELSPLQAVQELRILPYEELICAKPDHHRSLRLGFPEVIFGQGKTVEQIVTIAERLAARSGQLLITRVSREIFDAVREKIPDATYNSLSMTILLNRKRTTQRPGIAVVTGGTADIPVAEEAAVIAELMGNKVERVYDVGVAGIHRLLDKLPQLRKARVIIAVAGMEGALPSVVGGLVPIPVIAVPTSVGYGASFAGLGPLLTMLNSCAPGVAVVNIDNGFGAGYIAGLINHGVKAQSER
ncbi:MAG TPA: nickel pincer cofactor biosynthesis protein LarB [Dehalococcoidia bacterium]|nr:nickel pincer cofactor biosynthesis protein LarB [Dehalococcoidia bacterium]